ncbi:MAG: sigma-70 family RNA polymerase sigma factor [Myxococcales bacterium]|nr:sigma-70 family RNA polymerase sigma factor [Myxococcales bacterium]
MVAFCLLQIWLSFAILFRSATVLLASAAGGKRNDQMVAELYERTGGLVLRRCRRILRDPSEAEDAMQEVYLRVLKYGSSVEGEINLSWLYRTAERCCFDRLKKRSKNPVHEDDDFPDVPFPGLGDRAEAGQFVKQFFHGLDEKLQQLALLYYVDELSQEEAAQALGWSRRTVGKKLDLLKEKAERLARQGTPR